MKLNLGCGSNKINDYINIDIEKSCEPDLVLDFTKEKLPYEDRSVTEVCLFHTIEHIERKYHVHIFSEIWRVLQHDALFILSFPEFIKCAENYINNYRGQRRFWENTIYGRQLYPSDFHVCAMNSDEVKYLLTDIGFHKIEVFPEISESYNSVVMARRGKKIQTLEEATREAIYSNATY